MKLPLQVNFRDMAPLPSLEAEIRSHAEKLDQWSSELMSCHVVVEAAGSHHRQGHVYMVKIDLRVPGEEVFIGDHHGNEDIHIAVRDAFEAAGRRLEDYARRRRGQVKQHVKRGEQDETGETGERDE